MNKLILFENKGGPTIGVVEVSSSDYVFLEVGQSQFAMVNAGNLVELRGAK